MYELKESGRSITATMRERATLRLSMQTGTETVTRQAARLWRWYDTANDRRTKAEKRETTGGSVKEVVRVGTLDTGYMSKRREVVSCECENEVKQVIEEGKKGIN